MVSTSKFYRVIMFSDRVQPALCQYIFTTESSAKYCADRYIKLYHLSDATYKIIPLKVISYEKSV